MTEILFVFLLVPGSGLVDHALDLVDRLDFFLLHFSNDHRVGLRMQFGLLQQFEVSQTYLHSEVVLLVVQELQIRFLLRLRHLKLPLAFVDALELKLHLLSLGQKPDAALLAEFLRSELLQVVEETAHVRNHFLLLLLLGRLLRRRRRTIALLEDLVLWVECGEQEEHPLFVWRVAPHVCSKPLVLAGLLLCLVVAVLLDHRGDDLNEDVVGGWVETDDGLDVELLGTVARPVEDFEQELLRSELVLQRRKEEAVGLQRLVQLGGVLDEHSRLIFREHLHHV